MAVDDGTKAPLSNACSKVSVGTQSGIDFGGSVMPVTTCAGTCETARFITLLTITSTAGLKTAVGHGIKLAGRSYCSLEQCILRISPKVWVVILRLLRVPENTILQTPQNLIVR